MLTRRETWTRIATFIAVTYLWSFIFMGMAIRDGDITLVTALGGMWSPFVGVLVTRLIFPDGRRRGSLAGLGWTWGRTGWQVGSWFLPALYVGLAHAVLWLSGLAGFTDAGAGDIALFVLKRMAMGVTIGAALAFGEEVGWQGFLVPRVYRMLGFTKSSLFRGVVWSVWHWPLIMGGVYGTSATPVWYKIIFFTITMTAVSFAFTWFRMKSGSLWTGVWMHAAHNIFFQSVYPGLTTESPNSAWLVDEFGVFSAAVAVLVALFYWSRRHELPEPARGPVPLEA
jgi:membrane protease YdiL (CAAX protease family)